jgi:hypothetical protein
MENSRENMANDYYSNVDQRNKSKIFKFVVLGKFNLMI